MNMILRCEQCGVDKPCVVVMMGTDKFDINKPPTFCHNNGGTAKWNLLTGMTMV